METKERNISFDCLRATACVFIILLHTVYSTTLMYAEEMTPARTMVSQIVMNNLMWAVPCFIMVTGALLLDPEKKIGYRTLFSKYIARMVKAIVLFCLLFVVLEMVFNPGQRTVEHFLGGVWEIFTGRSWAHMWYLYCLVGLYLLLPAYKKIAELSSEREILYLLAVYGTFRSLLPVLGIWKISAGFYIHVSTIYPFWLFLGYWLNRWGRKRSRAFYAALFAIFTALLAALTWVRVRWGLAAMDDSLFGYSSPLVIGQAAGLAGWFFQCKQEGFPRLKKCLVSIDRHSFGIYLIHMAYVRLIYKHLHFDPFRIGGVLGVLMVVAFAFAMAYLTDVVMKKLPLFRSVV